MFIYICILYTLFIFSVQSKQTISYENVQSTNKTSEVVPKDLLKETNITFISEGGTIISKKPDISLPTGSINSLTSLDEEFSKTKQKPIVARKGVDNMIPHNITLDQKNSSETSLENDLLSPVKLNSSVSKSPVAVSKPSNVSDSVANPVTPKPIIKKPTLLSYEALAEMDKKIQSDQAKVPAIPSTKTLASSQIPSPNEDVKPQVYPARANSHPGMIMPVVITILVVPMFAIVGYMALKRGQDAWKNRHYKRMDFLLDGMYND